MISYIRIECKKARKNWPLLVMISLPILYFILFKYLPIYGVSVAFFDYKPRLGLAGSKFVGFKHFQSYLSDAYFWKLVRNTIVLQGMDLVFGFPIPILFSLLLNEIRAPRYKKIIQSLSYLPHFISTVVVCGMIKNFFSNSGVVNSLLAALGGEKIQFLTRSEYFRSLFVGSGIWQQMGWNSIIYLAALSNVDLQLYEAATIDGANRFQQMLHITIPCLVPTIVIMLVLRMGSMMSIGHEKVLLLYSGTTYETADVISTYVYRRSLINSDFSYGTAVGLFSSVINFLFLCGANWLSKSYSESSLW